MKMKMKKIFSVLSIAVSFLFGGIVFGQAISPKEVKNVSATAQNGEVTLRWNESTDEDGVVVGYKIYFGRNSVKTGSDSYDEDISVSSKTTHTIKNLQNGSEYFFALTAIDDEENESETYSKEVSAIPEADSPAVISATQESNTIILITMSKPVKLQGGTSSFYFEEKGTRREIPIKDINVEKANVRITIAADALDFDKKYNVMATSLVEDLSGNPVRSGITDSAEFKAIYIEEKVVQAEPSSPPPPHQAPTSPPQNPPAPNVF